MTGVTFVPTGRNVTIAYRHILSEDFNAFCECQNDDRQKMHISIQLSSAVNLQYILVK